MNSRNEGDVSGQVKLDLSSDSESGQVGKLDLSPDSSCDELRHQFDASAPLGGRDVPNDPALHGSAIRQVVSGKLFKKCKSATFQIDGATYTIGELF